MPFNGFPKPKKDGKGINLIKSIQRGTATIAIGSNNTLIAIANINPNNSVATINFNGNAVYADISIYVDITKENEIKIGRQGTTNTQTVEWCVIEYYAVKSLQKGTSVITGASLTVNITAVNPQKALLFYSYSCTDPTTTDAQYLFTRGRLDTTSTLYFAQSSTFTKSIYWRLIEFY